MNTVLVILIVALIAKDTAYLGDPYVMRGISQVLCLGAGVLWLLSNSSLPALKRYRIILAYVFILFITTFKATNQTYVFLQVTSLAAVVIFFIAFFESRRNFVGQEHTTILINTTVIAYSIVALISLFFAIYKPGIAYEYLPGSVARFRGLFSKPGMMGAAAGLLVGFSLFGIRNRWLKAIGLISGLLCLGLTLSRTFWIAGSFSLLFVTWRYYPRRRAWLLIVSIIGVICYLFSLAFEVYVDQDAVDDIVRVGSIAKLSGRIGLWERGIAASAREPLLGYGFTEGARGLAAPGHVRSLRSMNKIDPRATGRETLHSGYLQSLVDSGIIGFTFYIGTFILAGICFFRFDKDKVSAAEFYGFLFLAIANLAENIIYSSAIFTSVVFWGLAIYGLSLRRKHSEISTRTRAAIRSRA